LETLFDLFDALTIAQAVIFCKTRACVDLLREEMTKREFLVTSLHGDMTAQERDSAIKEFRTGSSRVLVTHDLFAGKIDIAQISLTIQYELPANKEDYMHRIGRSGKFGRKGLSIVLATAQEMLEVVHLERFYNTKIDELPIDIADLL